MFLSRENDTYLGFFDVLNCKHKGYAIIRKDETADSGDGDLRTGWEDSTFEARDGARGGDE